MQIVRQIKQLKQLLKTKKSLKLHSVLLQRQVDTKSTDLVRCGGEVWANCV